MQVPHQHIATFSCALGDVLCMSVASMKIRGIRQNMSRFSARALDVFQKPIGMLAVVFLEVIGRLTQLFLGAPW